MLHNVTCRALALAATGCLLAVDASALTVGRARGAVLLGRPLEVTIPVTLDAPSQESPCASADVFYGEDQVRRPPSVRWEPAHGGADGVLRVLSPLPVDEPMVTVYLRVGCNQSTTRRFVMLSEVPPEPEAGTPAARAPSLVQPAPGTGASVPPAQAQAGRREGESVPALAAGPLGPRRRQPTPTDAAVAALRAERALPGGQAAARTSPAAPPSQARKPARGQPQARLKLEPLDLSPERDPVLRLSSELRSEVATDPQKRAAAATLWQTLQKSPDETLKDALRLQAAEGELKSLRDSTRGHSASVAEMRAQVEQARSERRVAATLVAVLSAFLLALLGWLGWRWYRGTRMHRVGRWFEQNGESAFDNLREPGERVEPAVAPPPLPRRVAMPSPTAAAALAASAASAAAAATATAAATASAPARAESSPPRIDDFLASRGGSARMVGVEELIDLHDKADFFLSIGEYEQAIAVLEAHVHDQVETSALAWMDLLELYHSLGKRSEFEQLRSEFRQHFTGQVPDFEHFDQPSATLENYGRALSRIVALWPSERVLEVIEESIFRKPGLAGSEPFSLEAYRELVLLYHVAKDVSQSARQGQQARPAVFHDTSVQPLNMAERLDALLAENDSLLIPPPSTRLGVDIDIGELAAEAPEPRELSDLDFDLGEPEEAPAWQRKRS